MKTAILLLVLSSSVLAQDRFFYPKAEAGRVTVTKGLEYKPGQKYNVHRPAGDAVVPVVIFVNVGNAPYQDWFPYTGWGDAVANAGMAAVLYQGAQGTAAAEFDALVADLRKRANDLKIDPTRVAVWSSSSNATVGLPIVMDSRRDYIRSAVVYYGTAVVENIRADLPLLFIRSGLDTSSLNQSIDRLLSRALAANAPWTIENYGGGLHGFEVLNDTEITRLLIERTLAFMKLNMRPEITTAYTASAADATLGAAFARGEWTTAISGYRSRIAANPRDGESTLRLGIALLRNQQYEEALQMMEKAWELGRRGPRDVALPASEAAARAGNVQKAVQWLEVILSTRFGPPIAEVRTSEAYARISNEPAFIELLDRLEKQKR